MSHALIPNFSVPLVPIHDDRDRVPFHADPILAAIDAHSEAWSVFRLLQTVSRLYARRGP